MSKRLAGVALLLALVVLAVALHPLHDVLRGWMDAASSIAGLHPYAGALIFILLSMVSAMVAFFSTAAVVPIGVASWGKGTTLLLLWSGWWLGGAVTYCIGRYLGRGVVVHFIDAARLRRYEREFTKIARLPHVILLQLALPSEIPGYVLGVLRCRARIYLLALAIAELPFAFGAVYLGDSFLRGEPLLLIAVGAAGIAFCWSAATVLRHRLSVET